MPAVYIDISPPGRVPSRMCHGRTAERLGGEGGGQKEQSQGKVGVEGLTDGAHSVSHLVVWYPVGSCWTFCQGEG